MTAVSPSRRLAYDILHKVAADDAYANLELNQSLRSARLSVSDAGLTTELVYTALRRRLTLDAIIAGAVDRPLVKLDPRLLDVLRLALVEHLYLRTPAHAVANNAVELAKSVAGLPGSKLVNAVVRRLLRSQPDVLMANALEPLTGDDRLAVQTSHPAWIVRALRDVVGPAEIEELLAANNDPAEVTLVARPGRADRADLPGRPTPWSPWGVYLDGGSPRAVPGVAEGRVGVQDLGSQLTVLAFSRAAVPDDRGQWLDMCAGPGGKAALLADLAGPEGRLVAVEQHEHRAELVRRALRGAAAKTEVVVGDAGQVTGEFDRVLLDTPCTGLGVLRRRPEVRWRRQPSDVADLAMSQERLLHAALDACRPGGVVAYVTCSPHLAETEFVIADVLKRRKDATLESAAGLLPEVPDCADGDFVRLWPHRHGTDGMFLAVLRRV